MKYFLKEVFNNNSMNIDWFFDAAVHSLWWWQMVFSNENYSFQYGKVSIVADFQPNVLIINWQSPKKTSRNNQDIINNFVHVCMWDIKYRFILLQRDWIFCAHCYFPTFFWCGEYEHDPRMHMGVCIVAIVQPKKLFICIFNIVQRRSIFMHK